MSYSYVNGDGPSVLLVTEPDGASEPVSVLDNAIRQIKAYINDPTAGPAALISALLPAGMVVGYAGTGSAPAGWLLCDGSAVTRTGTYAALFTAIGTTYGVGDGSTTFNVPDSRGRVHVGAGQGAGLTNRVIGATGGEETHTLLQAELPNVNFQQSIPYSNESGTTNPWGSGGGAAEGSTTLDIPSGGSGTPFNVMQPFLVVTKIIKY